MARVGGVLRRTGIDGLPQLIDVPRGEMSIVGPSLCVTIVVERISFIQQRYRMRPGMTGWAQVNGCGGEVVRAGAPLSRGDYTARRPPGLALTAWGPQPPASKTQVSRKQIHAAMAWDRLRK